MSIILFFAVIFVLVLVHEFGHFIVAKKTGMRVDEFGIGFPPKVASIKKGETEYSFNLFPVGGFVRIFGEDAADAEGASDRERSFVAKTPLQQAAVLVAGVTFNMLFAWMLFIIVIAAGVPTVVDESMASENASVVVSEVLSDSPAAQAGIERGAILHAVSVDGEVVPITTISAFQEYTRAHGTEEMSVTYTKGGVESTVQLTPETDLVEGSPEVPVIGVGLSMIDVVSEPLRVAVWQGTVQTWDTLVNVTVGILTLLKDTVLLQADLTSVAGPVGIVGLVDEAAQFGLSSLLLFTALISVNLAVINMLPFPALDGGRLLFVLIEVIKGSPIKPLWVMRLNTVGFFLLIGLMVAVTWSDISKLI